MSLDFLENRNQSFDKYYSSNFVSGDTDTSLEDIKNEESGGDDEQPENNDLYKSDKPDKEKTSFFKTTIKTAKKNKTLLAIVSSGGIVVIGIIIAVMFLAQELPAFAAILASQSLARVNRTFEEQDTALTAEDAALDSEKPTVRAQTEADYGDTGELLTDLENYNPPKAINNLDGNGTLEFNYNKTTGGEVLKSIDIDTPNGSEVIPESPVEFNSGLHAVQTLGNSTDMSNLSSAIGETDVDGAVLLKFGAIGDIATDLGGDPEGGLDNAEFEDEPKIQEGKIAISPQEEAEITLNEQAEQDINPSSDIVSPLSYELNSAIGSVEGQESNFLSNPSSAQTQQNQASLLESGGDETSSFFSDALGTISKAVDGGAISKLINPFYAIAVPACIIYDGSLQKTGGSQPTTSGQVINNNIDETERTYFLVQSTSAQGKAGGLSAAGEGAMVTKLGNVIKSNVEEEASGEPIHTNNSVISPEAATDGQYSILSVYSPLLADFLDPLANALCPELTNPTFSILVLLAFVLAQLEFEVGLIAEALTPAIDALIDIGTSDLTTSTIADILADLPAQLSASFVSLNGGEPVLIESLSDAIPQILKIEGAKFTQYITTTGVEAGFLTGTTWILTQDAKAVVAQDAGNTYDGYSQGLDFANQAQAGGEAIASQTMQTAYYGAPLDPSQITYNDGQDRAGLALQNSARSPYQRYFALSNPYSLLSKVTSGIYADISNFSLKSIVGKVASVFNPGKLVNDIGSLFNKKTFAASTTSSTSTSNDDYGLVQFGYTSQEQALMNPLTGNPSYQPLENAKILAESGESNYISQAYGACFTEPVGTLMTTEPSTGPAAGNAYIVRNKDGSIAEPSNNPSGQNYGACSNYYLGPDSADPNAKDVADGGKYGNDLIFRWRLNQAYIQSLSTLEGVQNANSSN